MSSNLIVAIPTRERAQTIQKILTDLGTQTDQKFTIIVFNDGATQITRAVTQSAITQASSLGSPTRWHYLESTVIQGLCAARNRMLDFIAQQPLRTPTFVAFLDDDMHVDEHFVEQVKRYAAEYDGFCFRLIQEGLATTYDIRRFPILQQLCSPLVGTIIPALGVIFGGFYIKLTKIKKVDHLYGGCLIYNFSKNREARFDRMLNRGNFVAEDTCFSYGLRRSGTTLAYISSYAVRHIPPHTGGSKIGKPLERFAWYWEHKFCIIAKYHSSVTVVSAIASSFIECCLVSLSLRRWLVPTYVHAVSSYAHNFHRYRRS